jgi:hypothetical protein
MNHDDSMATDDNTQVSADDNDHSSVNDHTVHSAAMEDENEHDESASSNKAVMSSHSVAHLKPEEVAAYQLIFDRLAKVRKIDRRRWHHRPIFRVIIKIFEYQIIGNQPLNLFLNYSTHGCTIIYIVMQNRQKQT